MAAKSTVDTIRESAATLTYLLLTPLRGPQHGSNFGGCHGWIESTRATFLLCNYTMCLCPVQLLCFNMLEAEFFPTLET